MPELTVKIEGHKKASERDFISLISTKKRKRTMMNAICRGFVGNV
jgi:hypothetical protein